MDATVPEETQSTSTDALLSKSFTLSRALEQLQVSKEDDQHRSNHFQQVALELDALRFAKPPISATGVEVLSFLGLPEFVAGDESRIVYRYTYTLVPTKHVEEVMVEIEDGMFTKMGWNGASVNDAFWQTQKRIITWSDILHTTDRGIELRIPR